MVWFWWVRERVRHAMKCISDVWACCIGWCHFEEIDVMRVITRMRSNLSRVLPPPAAPPIPQNIKNLGPMSPLLRKPVHLCWTRKWVRILSKREYLSFPFLREWWVCKIVKKWLSLQVTSYAWSCQMSDFSETIWTGTVIFIIERVICSTEDEMRGSWVRIQVWYHINEISLKLVFERITARLIWMEIRDFCENMR